MSDQNDPKDTEGHKRLIPGFAREDDDTEGQMKGKSATDDDTEGHRRAIPGIASEDDDLEGHIKGKAATDDDTEGHIKKL